MMGGPRFFLLAAMLLTVPLCRARSDPQDFHEIDKGRYLATAGDCTACHTAPGGKPFAGGLPIETPFGTLVTPNITPDRTTGIGAWSDDDFVRAMQKGIGQGGQHLYPAFPYPYFTRMTREDILDVRRYLDTLEPVSNAVHSDQLPFPFRIRAVMAGWNWLFFKKQEFRSDPAKSAEWNRGAYLVEGLGHCGACHTAKNVFGADKTSRALQGGVLQGWFAPNLTSDRRVGIGGWSVEELADYLRTGHNKFAAASGPMAEVVTRSTSHLNAADLRAMAVWLKDLPAGQTAPVRTALDQTVMAVGSDIFRTQCGSCHQPDGAGIGRLFPALAKAPDVQSDNPANLLRILLEGGKSVATSAKPTGAAMPAFGWKYNDQQLAAVATYVRNTWGNTAAAVSAEAVAAERRKLSSVGD